MQVTKEGFEKQYIAYQLKIKSAQISLKSNNGQVVP
jgi:hypothetical protein